MQISSKDPQLNTASIAEVWFAKDKMFNGDWYSDTVYAIHQSSDTQYPYFRSLVEYSTFDCNCICTEHRFSDPQIGCRYIGESAKINDMSLSKLIFPAFLREQGYLYAYVYESPQSEYQNWYSCHTGTTPYIGNYIYEIYDDINGCETSTRCDTTHDVIIQFASSLDSKTTTNEIVTCVHTSNFSKPHMSQITRVGTQENYGNVLSTNSFMSLAGTMNGFVYGNMLIAEDFSMRYIGDQLKLDPPTGLTVCFMPCGNQLSPHSDDPQNPWTTVCVNLPGNDGCFIAEVNPVNAISTSVTPTIECVTVNNGGTCTCTPYQEGCPGWGSIDIKCYNDRTQFVFLVNDATFIPENIWVNFKVDQYCEYNISGILKFTNKDMCSYVWQPSNSDIRTIKVDTAITQGYNLYYPNLVTSILSVSEDSNADIIICPSNASNKTLSWEKGGCPSKLGQILGGALEVQSQCCCNRNLIWVGTLDNATPYTCECIYEFDTNTYVTVWKNIHYTTVDGELTSSTETSYLYSLATCVSDNCYSNAFANRVDLYMTPDLTGEKTYGYTYETSFTPKLLTKEALGSIYGSENLVSCLEEGYLECLSDMVACPNVSTNVCICSECTLLKFTYEPTGIHKINDTYLIDDYWPECTTTFNWRVEPIVNIGSTDNLNLCSLPYCVVRAMCINLDPNPVGVISCDNEGKNQCATYTIHYGTTANGAWNCYCDLDCWGEVCDTATLSLKDYPDITSSLTFKVDSNTTNFYYASMKIDRTEGSDPMPDASCPFVLPGECFRISDKEVSQYFRYIAKPYNSCCADGVQYYIPQDECGLMEVLMDEQGQYWHVCGTPDNTVITPADVPVVHLGICSCVHCEIYSNDLVVRPTYPVTEICLSQEGTSGHTLVNGDIVLPNGNQASPNAGEYTYYLQLSQPITAADGLYAIDIDEFVVYNPSYATHAPGETHYTVDSSIGRDGLTCGLDLCICGDDGHGYLTMNLCNGYIVTNCTECRSGVSQINISMDNIANSLPFYIMVSQEPISQNIEEEEPEEPIENP